MRFDQAIDELAASQHACVAVWQLREMGLLSAEITRLRRSQHWSSLSRRVLARSGAPATQQQLACAAVLEAGHGGALAALSSASSWGLGAWYQLLPACVMTDRPAASFGGEIGHIYPRCGVSDRWITTLDGIPIVKPELCLYQLAGLLHPGRVERALDTALSMRLVSVSSARACLDDLAKQGRNGTVVFRQLLDARPIGYVPFDSGLEARFEQVMSEGGLGGWRRQVDSGGETWAGRVDFRHRVYPVVAEVLSARYHAALSSRRDDALRRAKLEAAGLAVAEVWDHQVWHAPGEARSIVRAAVRSARAQAS